MKENVEAVEVDMDKARSWLERSLAQGFDVSKAILAAAPFDHGCFHAFAPHDAASGQFDFAEGGIVREYAAVEALAGFLDGLVNGDSCVIVEDDLLRRTDPGVARGTSPLAFVGDRVLHWSDLAPGAGICGSEAIRQGASGYPLNAFVSTEASGDLGLLDRQQVLKDVPDRVAASLWAVVVSAFDAESFLVWSNS